MSQRIVVCMLVILGRAAVARAQSAAFPVALTQTQTIGMVGLARGQTARLNLLNAGGPMPFATGGSCTAQVDFLDDQGFILKTAVLTIPPGKSLPFDLNRDTDLTVLTPRVEIRAILRIPPLAGGVTTAQLFNCSLLPTLEIFDNADSKTLLIMIGARYSPGPIPLTATN